MDIKSFDLIGEDIAKEIPFDWYLDEDSEVLRQETVERVSKKRTRGLAREESAPVKFLASKPTPMRILEFLLVHGATPRKEIFLGVQENKQTMSKYTFTKYLKSLIKLDILVKSNALPDKRYVCYSLNPGFPIHEIFRYRRRYVGWKLYRLLPIGERISEYTLRENKEFKEVCDKNYLTCDEAILSLRENTYKVLAEEFPESFLSTNLSWFFTRKGQ